MYSSNSDDEDIAYNPTEFFDLFGDRDPTITDDEIRVFKWLYEHEPTASKPESNEDVNKSKPVEEPYNSTGTIPNEEASINVGNNPDTASNTEARMSLNINPNASTNTETTMSGTENNCDKSEFVVSKKKSVLNISTNESDGIANAKDVMREPTTTEVNTSSTTDNVYGASKPTSTAIDVPVSTSDIKTTDFFSATASSASPRSIGTESASSSINSSELTGTIPQTGFTSGIPNSGTSKNIKSSAPTTNSTGLTLPAPTGLAFLTHRTPKSIGSDSLSTESSSAGSISGGTISEEFSENCESNSSGYGSPNLPFTATCDIIQKPTFAFETPKFEPLNKTLNSSTIHSLFGKPAHWNIRSATPSDGPNSGPSSTNASNLNKADATTSRSDGCIIGTTKSTGAIRKTTFSFGIPESEYSKNTSIKNSPIDISFGISSTGTSSAIGSKPTSTLATAFGANSTVTTSSDTVPKTGFTFKIPDSVVFKTTNMSSTPTGLSFGTSSTVSSINNEPQTASSITNSTESKIDETTSKPEATITDMTNSTTAKPKKAVTSETATFGAAKLTEPSTKVSDCGISDATNLTDVIPKTTFSFGVPNVEATTSPSTVSSTKLTATYSSETTSGAKPKTTFSFKITNSGSSKATSSKSSTNETNSSATNSSETTSGAKPKTSFSFGIPNSESSKATNTKSSTKDANSNATSSTSGAKPNITFSFGITNSGSSKATSSKSSTNETNSSATNSSETTSGAKPKTTFSFGIPNSETSKSTSSKASTTETNSSATNSSETTSGAKPKTTFSFGIPNSESSKSTSSKASTSETNSSATNSSETTSGAKPKTTFSYGIPNSGSSKSTSTKSSTNKSSAAGPSRSKASFSFAVPKTTTFKNPNLVSNSTNTHSAPVTFSFGTPSTPILCDVASSSTNMIQPFKNVLCKPDTSKNSPRPEFVFGNTQGIGTGFFANQTCTATDWSGTGLVRYKPVRQVDTVFKGISCQNIDVNICVVSVMREYETKSIEELRYEDYMAGRKGRSQHTCAFCTPGAICVFDKNFAANKPPVFPVKRMAGRVSNGLTGTHNSSGRGTGVIRYRPTTDEERCNICVISAMKEYETKSLDELRYEDYMAKRQGQSTHKCSFCPSDHFCTFDEKYNTKPFDNRSPNACAFNTPSGSKSAFSTNNIFGAGSNSLFGAFANTTPFGIPTSNIPFETRSNNAFGSATSNLPFGTSARSSPFGTFNGPFGGTSSNAPPSNNNNNNAPTSNVPSTNASTFWSPSTAINAPSTNTSTFGSPSTAFNVPTTTNNPFRTPITAFNAPSTSKSILGQPTTASNVPSTNTSTFGSPSTASNVPSTSKSIFGQHTTASNVPSTNTSTFWSPSTAINAPSMNTSTFGSPSTASNVPSTSKSIFGQPTTASNVPSTNTSTFWSPSTAINAPSMNTSTFGSPSTAFNAPSTSKSIFGQPTTASNVPSTNTSTFGSPSTAFNVPSTNASTFGSPSTAFNVPSTNASTFGSPSTAFNVPSTNASTFGSPSTAINAPSMNTSTFGSPSTSSNAPSTSKSIFGTPSTAFNASSTNTSTFGSPSTAFNTPSTNTSTFGSPSTTSNAPSTSKSIFGTPSTAFNAPSMNTSKFGSSSTASNAPGSFKSLFGSPSTNSMTGIGTPSINSNQLGVSSPNLVFGNQAASTTSTGTFQTPSVSGIGAPSTNSNQSGASNLVAGNQSATIDGIDGNSSSCPYPYIPNSNGNRQTNSRRGFGVSTDNRVATSSNNRMINTSSNISGVAASNSHTGIATVSGNIVGVAPTTSNTLGVASTSSNTLGVASTCSNTVSVASTSSNTIGVASTSSNTIGVATTTGNAQATLSNAASTSTPARTYQNIPPNLISRLSEILKTGLSETSKNILQQEYFIPEDIALLKAPILNPEIANNEQITDDIKTIDKELQNQQDLLGNGVVAVIKAMDLLLKEDNIPQALRALYNSTRLLSVVHFNITEERANYVLPLLEANASNVLRERERDATLFGSDMSERVDVANMFLRSSDGGIRDVENSRATNESDVNQTEVSRMFKLLEINMSSLKTEILTKIDKLSEKVDVINDEREGDGESDPFAPSGSMEDSQNSVSHSSDDSTANEIEPLDDKFKIGNYVVQKSDIKWEGNNITNKPEELHFYSVDDYNLLSKYTLFKDFPMRDEIVTYKETHEYTKWSKKRSEDFISVTELISYNFGVRPLITSAAEYVTISFSRLLDVLKRERTT